MQVAMSGGAAAVVGGIQVSAPAIPLAAVVPLAVDATGAMAGIWLLSTPAEFEQALGGANNPLQAAVDRGMRTISGPSMPDTIVDLSEKLGHPVTREQIREIIHDAKRKMGIAADEDLIFDYSGGMWDSRTGEYIGKFWEPI